MGENTKKNKKAQITLFVILGLVLLIIFFLLITLKQCTQPRTKNTRIVLYELEAGSLKNYVTSCIRQTAMDGIEKIGENGGVIYDFQGGTIPFTHKNLGKDYLNYTPPGLEKTYFVSYGLKENTFCKNVTYKTPDYPYPATPFSKLNTIYSQECGFGTSDHPHAAFYGFFGQNNVMTKLCYLAKDSGCEGFAKGREIGLTIQRQLEDYITNNLPVCVNFSVFTNRMNANITPEEKPFVEVSIVPSEIIIFVRYPLRISFENQKPVTRTLDYQTTVKVRLGLIYNFIYDVLSLDSKRTGFDITKDYLSSFYYNDGLELRKINNPMPASNSYYFAPFYYDDIIEVKDRKSLVNGRPFLFRVAVQNRKPALDLINNITVDLSNKDMPRDKPVIISIPLNSFDPDDNPVTYFFLSQGPGTGWRENDSEITRNLERGVLRFHIKKYDYGEHEVGILVLDDSGLFDYQWFNINVEDSNSNSLPMPACVENCIIHGCSSYAKDSCSCAKQHVNNCQPPDKLFAQPPAHDCEHAWCTVAANQCKSECQGEFKSDPNSLCWKCVSPIVHSGDLEKHIDCFEIMDKEVCIKNMPDCFWVRENSTNGFVESCYNDTSLSLVTHPAYIIVN